MIINLLGHSKKVTLDGMVGHVSAHTAQELKNKYGKAVKVENIIKQHKVRKSGPCVSIPVNQYLHECQGVYP